MKFWRSTVSIASLNVHATKRSGSIIASPRDSKQSGQKGPISLLGPSQPTFYVAFFSLRSNETMRGSSVSVALRRVERSGHVTATTVRLKVAF